MIAKLYDRKGELRHTVSLVKSPLGVRPDVVIVDNSDVYVADPFSIDGVDSWWRYSKAQVVHIAIQVPRK